MRLSWHKVYDIGLADVVTAAQRQDTLDLIVDAIHANVALPESIKPKASNRQYFEKLFREEAIKQFTERHRPALEVILNAIDARPSDTEGTYRVAIKLTHSSLSVKDSGDGLGLREMLAYLLTPFMSDKKGADEIGQFGVGFLSTFNYLIDDPNHTHITFATRKRDGEAYTLELYSTGENAADIRVRIKQRAARGPAGSLVTIKRQFDLEKVKDYLDSNLSGIPPSVADLTLNGKALNPLGEDLSYAVNVPFMFQEKTIIRPIGIRVRPVPEYYHANGFSISMQGVPVLRAQSYFDSGSIAFPPIIRLVEGRDDFKRDENFNRAVRAVFTELLPLYIREASNGRLFPLKTINLVEKLSSVLGRSSACAEHLDIAIEALHPGFRAVLDKRHDNRPFLDFYSAEEGARFPVFESHAISALRVAGFGRLWPSAMRSLRASAEPVYVDPRLALYREHPSFEPEFHLLFRYLHEAGVDTVNLVDEPAYGVSPLLKDGTHACFLNMAHPLSTTPWSPENAIRLVYEAWYAGIHGAFDFAKLPTFFQFAQRRADEFPLRPMTDFNSYKVSPHFLSSSYAGSYGSAASEHRSVGGRL